MPPLQNTQKKKQVQIHRKLFQHQEKEKIMGIEEKSNQNYSNGMRALPHEIHNKANRIKIIQK